MNKILIILTFTTLSLVGISQDKQKVVFSTEEGVLRKDGSNINYWLRCSDNPFGECDYTLYLEKGSYEYYPFREKRKRAYLLVTNDSVFVTFVSDNLEFKIIKE